MPISHRLPREKRREQLIAVATSLFAAEGYHTVAMEDIARSSNVTKPVLYQHFRSKEDLYLAVVDEVGAQLVATMAPALATETPNRVAYAIETYFDFMTRPDRFSQVLLRPEQITPDINAHIRGYTDTLRQMIADAITTGRDADPAHAMLAAQIVTEATRGAAVLALAPPDDDGRTGSGLPRLTRPELVRVTIAFVEAGLDTLSLARTS